MKNAPFKKAPREISQTANTRLKTDAPTSRIFMR